MTGSATFLPTGLRELARPVSTFEAARPVNRPTGAVAGDVMNRDPDRVAGSDTLMEVAGKMRDLLVAFLPVCDQNGDLQGIIALLDLHHATRRGEPGGVTAAWLAREPAATIGVDDSVAHVRGLMAEQRMWLLPVLERRRRLVGVIYYGTVMASPVRSNRLGCAYAGEESRAAAAGSAAGDVTR